MLEILIQQITLIFNVSYFSGLWFLFLHTVFIRPLELTHIHIYKANNASVTGDFIDYSVPSSCTHPIECNISIAT
jgi:hypothetical protein